MSSVFSGKAGRNAGIWATQQALQDWETGNSLIDQGKTDAIGAIDRGRTSGLAALEAGNAAAHPNYANAIQRFAPWAAAGGNALSNYQDSLGVNGEAGFNRSVGTFRESPGYRYQVDQASDAVARRASALGALGSGNTMAAIADRSRNMADAEFGKYQDRLSGLSTQGLAASGQMAGLEQAWGNLAQQLGRDQAGIYTGTGAQEAGIYGNAANQGLQNLAQMSQTKIGAGSGAMMAGQNAAQNRMNFGMQLGSLGVGLLGNAFGGGFGSLGSMFGGGAAAANPTGFSQLY